MILAATLFVLLVLVAAFFIRYQLRRRHMDRWLASYLLETPKRKGVRIDEEVHLLLCIGDHFEPKVGDANYQTAAGRVQSWVEGYPRLFSRFRDSDGRPPRHTFFFPLEEYEPEFLDALAGLCRGGFGEVEVHLHHDGATAEGLRDSLGKFTTVLSERHGLLSRHRRSPKLAYGFIHGNWALNNSRPDGRWCGVNDEITVLRETGCYADFTLPSAPSPTQTRKINSIYYATSDPRRPKGHDCGPNVGTVPSPANSLMLIQGPLLLDWTRCRWGLVPRIENGCLQGTQPPSIGRLDHWLKARVQVRGRPDWFFVKLHTHGASEENQAVLLGEPTVAFHNALASRARANASFQFHYVTAREMFNLARAAEAGWMGSVAEARDFELVSNIDAMASKMNQRPGPSLIVCD
jgi:hypothetical protein